MRTITLVVAVFFFGAFSALSQESTEWKTDLNITHDHEFEAIAQTVSYYLDGGTHNDFATLKKAFHKDAMMTYLAGEEYKSVNAIDFFEAGMKPGPKSNRKTRIESIDVDGHAARAKLEITYDTFRFIDYMTLLKIDGEWKIVSKVFYRDVFEVK